MKDDKKKYAKIYDKYKNMSQTKKNVECAHFQYQKDIFPAIGLYVSLFAMAVNSFFDSKVWAAITIVSLAFIVFRLALIVKNASIHLSVISDIEKEESM